MGIQNAERERSTENIRNRQISSVEEYNHKCPQFIDENSVVTTQKVMDVFLGCVDQVNWGIASI